MTTPCKRRFHRGLPEHPLTEKKLVVLDWITDLQPLTPIHLAGLTEASLKAARLHLRDLYDLGLVERTGIPTLTGSAPMVYTLSAAGARLQRERGLEAEAPRLGESGGMFLPHTLQVRDVRVWLERLHQAHEGSKGVQQWRDGKKAIISLQRVRAPCECRPDAWFSYAFAGATLVGFVEVDRGTERGTRWWEVKFAQYAALFEGERVKEVTGSRRGRMLCVTPSARRRDAIHHLLSGLLAKHALPPQRFWIAEQGVMDSTDVTASVWRVAGEAELRPLVPPQALHPLA